MENMQLPERLQAIADQVPVCEAMADVGCDHGYLPIYLIRTGKAHRALAMDVNQGPLDRASTHIAQQGLGDFIECRLSNGLEKIRYNEVQVVTIAGMGGMLIAQLLEEADAKVLSGIQTLILQPQTEPDAVRRKLHEKGFRIEDEILVHDRGKQYIICRAVHGQEYYEDHEYLYGKRLIEKKDPEYRKMLVKKAEGLSQWMSRTQSEEQKCRMEKERERILDILRSW